MRELVYDKPVTAGSSGVGTRCERIVYDKPVTAGSSAVGTRPRLLRRGGCVGRHRWKDSTGSWTGRTSLAGHQSWQLKYIAYIYILCLRIIHF